MTLLASMSFSEISEVVKKWWLTLQYERKCNSTNEVFKIVSRSSKETQLQVRELISLEIKRIVENCLESKSINDMQIACNAINGCFDNFIHATDAIRSIFTEVSSFIDFGLNECHQKLISGNSPRNSVLELLHCLSRILILVLKLKRSSTSGKKKCNYEITTEESIPTEALKNLLTELSCKIGQFLLMDGILIDTKNNLAMSIILIREILTPDEIHLREYHQKFVETIPEELLEECYNLNILKFLLCSAVINTWSVSIIDNDSTYTYLKFFINLCENYSSETPVILNTSRTLLLLVKHDAFKEFIHRGGQEKQQEIISMLLSCVFMLLEHPVACVRHSAKDFLHILAATPSLQPVMMESIFKLPSDKRCYFISIGALANEIGSRNLIDNYKYLPQQLLGALCDPTIVSHVSLALEFVILKDSLAEENFSEWCETWIVPLLILLMKVLPIVAADIDKLLEKAFKKYPNSIFYVTHKWANPASAEELRYIITALKISHKQGFLVKANFSNLLVNQLPKNENNLEPEKKLINENLLEHCLHQRDDDIRISTFSLLIEAHKSTKPYSAGDFKLISYFLKYNLNNQQPATRQKILGLIRKMLVRFSDSKATFLKPGKNNEEIAEKSKNLLLYDQFLNFLVEFCFSNIFVGCNFNRLNTVLNILLLCFENIKDMSFDSSKTEYYWSKFLIALDSSYEENKELAVVLSKKLDLSLLKANEPETTRSLLKKAFSLCSHMEPPDVLTGSSLLRTLMNLPSTKEVLSEYSGEDCVDVNYCCIEILVQDLKNQLHLAKLDLMTAATCGPMYGTLFAIRSILKNVNFSISGDNVMNKHVLAKWAKVLNDLIEISFEMTHIVGCVVNSSSPEGHLPMDFQTDFDNLCLNSTQKNEIDGLSEASLVGVKNISLLEVIYENFLRKFQKLDSTIDNFQYDAYETLRTLKSFMKENTLILCKLKENKSLKLKNVIDQLEEVKIKLEKHLENVEKESAIIEWPATAQVLLLCAWRSIKEATLYLGDFVTKLPIETAIELGLISKETIMKIGDELKILLCEIKHRGAFEQAYIGFTQLVNSLWKCSDKSLNGLPRKWLDEIINQLESPLKDQKMKLCSTRRSAGLPFLVQAIICSEIISVKSSTPSSLHSTMKSLLEITENGVEGNADSKIHALNILRALFKHAQLGEHVASYVSRALMTAIRGSRGATWSERNSSSLLFSSLIIRIFGVARSRDEISKKNRMTSRTFFQRYSELYEFLLSEMELVYSKENYLDGLYPKPSLYLVLLILGRLYPPPTEDPENIDLSEFLPYINMSRRNPTMKIRELGARALVPLIPLDRLIEELDDRFSKLSLKKGIGQNERHGILLQIKALLNESNNSLENLTKDNCAVKISWLENTKWMLQFEDQELVPFITLSAYLKVLHIFFKNYSTLRETIFNLIATVNFMNFNTTQHSIVPGMFLFLGNFYYLKTDVLGYQWLQLRDCRSKDNFFKLLIFMLNCGISEVQSIPLRILCLVLPHAADFDDEDLNGIQDPIEELLIFQSQENVSFLKQEILSNSEIIKILIEPLNNDKHEYFKSKVIHRLWLKTISNLVMNGIISINSPKQNNYLNINFSKSLLKSGDKSLSTNGLICQAIYLMEQIALKDNDEFETECRLKLFEILNEFSSGEADIRERIAVANIFNRFYGNFTEQKLIDDPVIMNIWMIPLKLLVDEDSSIRIAVAEFVHKMQSHISRTSSNQNLLIEMKTLDWPHLPLVSLKAQESLLDCYINLLRDENLLYLVVQMIIIAMSSLIDQDDPDLPLKDEFGVFEKGNPNPFSEVLALSNLMCNKLAEIRSVADLESILWCNLNDSLAKFIADNLHLDFTPATLMESIESITTIIEESKSLSKDFSLSRIQVRHLRNALGLAEIV